MSQIKPVHKRAIVLFARDASREHQHKFSRGGCSIATAQALVSNAVHCVQRFKKECDIIHAFDGTVPVSPTIDQPGIHRVAQSVGTFQRRIETLISSLTNAGYESVVIVGSDTPTLRASDISRSLKSLNTSKKVIIGPDKRGGMWLFGFQAGHARHFFGLNWCSSTLYSQLRINLARHGICPAILSKKRDINRNIDILFICGSIQRLLAVCMVSLRRCQLLRMLGIPKTPLCMQQNALRRAPPTLASSISPVY